MDKRLKSCPLFICIITLLATLFHGGFFAVEYIAITISFLVFIIFSKEIFVSKSSFILIFGVVLLYYLSSFFSGYNVGAAISESAKPLLLLMASMVGIQLEKNNFMKSLIITAATLGIIGLFSLCRVIEFKDFVYDYNGVKSLQSTMQYANSTAIVLICGIFSVRALNEHTKNNFVYSATEILLTVCLLFTHSRIAISVYIILTILELLLLKGGISVKLILHFISGIAIYLIMQLLINKKLSFIALVLCIISVLLISENICKIKKTTIKINRLCTILLIGGIFSAMLISLCFADISTIMIRMLYYKDGIKALIHNPLLGISPGGWGEYQYNYQSAQYFVNQIHNGILQIGVDAGIFAMLLFIVLLVFSLVGLIKIWKKDKKTNDLYILLIFLALTLHGVLDFDFSYGNILIILGICISYGFKRIHPYKFKIAHKSLAAFLVVFLAYLGVSETILFMAQREFNAEHYLKASDYYETVTKMRPYDVDSDIMWSLCQAKLGSPEYAEKIVTQAYEKHPDNSDIVLKAMDIAANNKDFPLYISYQNQLLSCAPMQQNSYTSAVKYLDVFYQNNLIDESLYMQEKNNVIASAMETNEKMSRFNQYLDFGAEIDISSLK